MGTIMDYIYLVILGIILVYICAMSVTNVTCSYMILWCLKKSAIMRIRIPLKPPVQWEACSLCVESPKCGKTNLTWLNSWHRNAGFLRRYMDKHPKKYLKTQTSGGMFWMFGSPFFFSKSTLFWKAFLGIEVKLYEEILGCPGTGVRINGS